MYHLILKIKHEGQALLYAANYFNRIKPTSDILQTVG